MLEQFTWTLAQEDGETIPDAPAETDSQAVESQPADNGNGSLPQDRNPDGTSPGGLLGGMLPFILILGVFMVIMFAGQRREKKKRQQMMSSMKKGDRVQTIGGIIGTIVEVRDNELLVKVDETSNTRLRFARSAVQSVLEEK
ncbi:MAG: preprotein translocase subunit YajC [Phycisphaeraceae bacterium]